MAFSPDFLDQIRDRLPLSGVVGRAVKLTRAGREFHGLCPFHNEKTPSFTVNDQKGFFHCFGCGAHGDVVGFVMRHGRLSFPEAVEQLAGEAGLEVPRPSAEDVQRHQRRASLTQTMEAAAAFYQEQLWSAPGRQALAYARGRGLDDDAIQRWRLGFAPSDAAGLTAALAAAGAEPEAGLDLRLLIQPEDGRAPYAFFRNRLLFPITDARGRVIAFGGRKLEGDGPKYINSPETPLFDKGRTLFNLPRARHAAGEGHPILVVEGYLDVIALAEHGFPSAVAPLGTALTEAQMEQAWTMLPGPMRRPVLCFDGDNAGRRAAQRAMGRMLPILKPGHSADIVYLPEGEDPDTLVRGAAGPDGFRGLLAGARPLSELLWELTAEQHADRTPEGRAAFEAALFQACEAIQDRQVRTEYQRAFRERLFQARRAGDPARAAWPAGHVRPGPRPGGHPGARPGGRFADRFAPPLPAPVKRPGLGSGGRDHLLPLAVLSAWAQHPSVGEEAGIILESLPALPPLLQSLAGALAERGFDQDPAEDAAAARLDSAARLHHLRALGLEAALDMVLAPACLDRYPFARPGSGLNEAREGLLELHETVVRAHLLRDASANARTLAATSPMAEAAGPEAEAQLARQAAIRRMAALKAEAERMAPPE